MPVGNENDVPLANRPANPKKRKGLEVEVVARGLQARPENHADQSDYFQRFEQWKRQKEQVKRKKRQKKAPFVAGKLGSAKRAAQPSASTKKTKKAKVVQETKRDCTPPRAPSTKTTNTTVAASTPISKFFTDARLQDGNSLHARVQELRSAQKAKSSRRRVPKGPATERTVRTQSRFAASFRTLMLEAKAAAESKEYERAERMYADILEGPHASTARSSATYWTSRAQVNECLKRYGVAVRLLSDAIKHQAQPFRNVYVELREFVARVLAVQPGFFADLNTEFSPEKATSSSSSCSSSSSSSSSSLSSPSLAQPLVPPTPVTKALRFILDRPSPNDHIPSYKGSTALRDKSTDDVAGELSSNLKQGGMYTPMSKALRSALDRITDEEFATPPEPVPEEEDEDVEDEENVNLDDSTDFPNVARQLLSSLKDPTDSHTEDATGAQGGAEPHDASLSVETLTDNAAESALAAVAELHASAGAAPAATPQRMDSTPTGSDATDAPTPVRTTPRRLGRPQRVPVEQVQEDAEETKEASVPRVVKALGPPRRVRAKAMPEQKKTPKRKFDPNAVSDTGSVVVMAPVHASKAQKVQTEAAAFLSPVRRSARHRTPQKSQTIESLLESTDYCYAPNPHLPPSTTPTQDTATSTPPTIKKPKKKSQVAAAPVATPPASEDVVTPPRQDFEFAVPALPARFRRNGSSGTTTTTRMTVGASAHNEVHGLVQLDVVMPVSVTVTRKTASGTSIVKKETRLMSTPVRRSSRIMAKTKKDTPRPIGRLR